MLLHSKFLSSSYSGGARTCPDEGNKKSIGSGPGLVIHLFNLWRVLIDLTNL